MASGPKMTEFELTLRTRQPEELAEKRKHDAKQLITEQKRKDDQATAKREALMALRLEREALEARKAAAELAANPPPPSKATPRKKAVKSKLSR